MQGVFLCEEFIIEMFGVLLYNEKRRGGNMKFKVKYKRQKYKVSLCDKIKIIIIKFILTLKRITRGAIRLIPHNLTLYIFVTIFWIVFGVITYRSGIVYKAPDKYTIWDTIWELKNSYFTSVVLTLLITSYNQNKGYRDKLERQHSIYYDIISDFDKLFAPFIGEEILHYMPFYNDKCLSDTMNYIMNKKLLEQFDESRLIESISDVLEKITLLKHLERQGGIIENRNRDLLKDIIKTENDLMKVKANPKTIIGKLKDISNELFQIIEEIRRPWRRDNKYDIKILQLLNKENDVEEDFYYKMHLFGHTFEDDNK